MCGWEGMHGQGACIGDMHVGGVHDRGCAWLGACMVGGHVWWGAYMSGGMCMAGGHAWWGACMAGGMHAMDIPPGLTPRDTVGQ